MSFFNGFLFVLGIVLMWAGMPTLGMGLVFAVTLVGFCDEFGTRGRKR